MIQVDQTSTGIINFRGSHDEDKPGSDRGIKPGSTFYEWDTGDVYMYTGSEWLQQSSGGGGGGSFGTVATVIICGVSGGMPDPSSVIFYTYSALSGETQLVLGEVVSGGTNMGVALAAGLNVELSDFSDTITPNPNITLYDFDMTAMSLTEIPDTLTVDEYGGEVAYFKFTMPDVQDNATHMVVIGIPSGD